MAGVAFTPLELDRIQRTAAAAKAAKQAYEAPLKPLSWLDRLLQGPAKSQSQAPATAPTAAYAPQPSSVSWPLVLGIGALGLLAVAAIAKGGK